MNINIKIDSINVKDENFNYSNIESSYKNNAKYFTKNGEPYMIIAGEMHFSREPKYRWKELLLKMKALGLNAVTTYVFWNYHEEEKGVFDFSGNKDIKSFLQICKDVDMPCVLRIGPWCHGEVVYGGFPKRIANMVGKRSNDKAYLKEVKDFWQRLYVEVEPYLDGETVIGIQLENEYGGSIEHIKKLREIAEDIGYKTPFFTMTAWPSGKPSREFLPMFGGYPDAPWNAFKRALKPNNRFAITPGKTSEEIGADLITNQNVNDNIFASIPYATCEIGPGNQVTQHRRPKISSKDGYGVGFAKLASGVNFLGYYMFVGGVNPNNRPMQESKLTGYPNNYPMIDYDFQAPISKYGVVREHGHMLRLMHLATTQFDSKFCTKNVYFSKWKSLDPKDTSFLKCSVRVDDNLSGYFFAGSYEKAIAFDDFKDVKVVLSKEDKEITLPTIDVKAGSMFFYPFNYTIGNVNFDYILAQPIAKYTKKDEIICYFKEIGGIKPSYSINENKQNIELNKETKIGNVTIIVLDNKKALSFYDIDNKPYFLSGNVYKDKDVIYCEKESGEDKIEDIKFEKCDKVKLPYNYYMYSIGKRGYYKLTLPKDILKDNFDVELKFNFEGLNLQVFSEGQIINDYFNIDKEFVMNLRDYKEYLDKSRELIIRTAAKTRFGVSNVYNEIEIPLHSNKLELISAKVIKKEEIKL